MGGSMEQVDLEEHFPRTIYDESGRYTVSRYGQYEVKSPLIERYAAVVYIRRDLDSALEMVRACAAEQSCPGSPVARRCLWISAVVTYGKAAKRGGGRDAFDVKEYAEHHFDKERMRMHKYVLKLRDKMIAHDDSIGATKRLGIYLTPHMPGHPHEFGIGGGNRQIVSLGSDIAKQLVPHFEWMTTHFAKLETTIRMEAQKTMLDTKFSDVVLLGPYVEEDMDVTIEGLVGPSSL